jgi:hypothetical protein
MLQIRGLWIIEFRALFYLCYKALCEFLTNPESVTTLVASPTFKERQVSGFESASAKYEGPLGTNIGMTFIFTKRIRSTMKNTKQTKIADKLCLPHLEVGTLSVIAL